MKSSLPPLDVLRQLLDYNPETGILTWKFRPRKFCKTDHEQVRWNKRFSGKQAGLKAKDGYLVMCVLNKQYKAHRVCWSLHWGREPQGQIDHINGDKTDNKINNLRDVSARENATNRKRISRNKSGYTGVSQGSFGKWLAYISTKEDRLFLGSFNCVTSAALKRRMAEIQYGYHENHGRH
jgi:hypothetical protein